MNFLRNAAPLVFAAAASVAVGTAAPTPVPGGANQVSAIQGKVGDTIFNGVLRIDVQDVRDATPDDHPEKALPSADQRVMIMDVLLRNGTHADFIDLITYTLADADDVSFEIPSHLITNANLHIQQGAAARQSAMFVVDKNYKPVKVLVQCVTCGSATRFRPLRLSIPQPQQYASPSPSADRIRM